MRRPSGIYEGEFWKKIMKKIIKTIPILIGLGVVVLGIATRPNLAKIINSNFTIHAADEITITFQPTDEDFLNPERGFHRCNVSLNPPGYFRLADENNDQSEVVFFPTKNLHWVRESGYTLVHSYVRLDDYRQSSLPDQFLNNLDQGFARLRESRIKTILRFSYNYGQAYEDASKEWIFRHLDQLKPILERNADVIVVLQAGFIGAWGEWHHSTHGLENTEDRRDILNKILASLPSSRMVQIRYPSHKNDIYNGQMLVEAESFSGSNLARTGYHNDCFLANDQDGGTYPAGQIDYWKNYIAQETKFVPMGGEVCGLSSENRVTCANALRELEQMHWSYLCRDFFKPALGKLESEGCLPEISRRLGYRFVLKRLKITDQVKPGDTLKFQLDLENEGFTAPFNERPVFLVLENKNTTSYRHIVFLGSVDPRRWFPDEIQTLDKDIPLPANLPQGSYKVFLWLPDAAENLRNIPEYAIRMANQNVWQPGSGFNLLFENLEINRPSFPSFSLSPGWNQITWPDVSGKKASDTPPECPTAVAKENFWFKPYVRNFGGVNFNFEKDKTYYIKCNQAVIWQL